MSDKWEIIRQESSVVGDIVAQVGSLGTQDGPITFTIRNIETGETREVVAWDRDELGERIADGEFDDDDSEDDDDSGDDSNEDEQGG